MLLHPKEESYAYRYITTNIYIVFVWKLFDSKFFILLLSLVFCTFLLYVISKGNNFGLFSFCFSIMQGGSCRVKCNLSFLLLVVVKITWCVGFCTSTITLFKNDKDIVLKQTISTKFLGIGKWSLYLSFSSEKSIPIKVHRLVQQRYLKFTFLDTYLLKYFLFEWWHNLWLF